jgi:chromosome segregation ATPase
MDTSIIITIVPPILTAIFAYLIARKRNLLSRAKLDADIQSQALIIVKGVMADMREELKREIDTLRREKDELKLKIDSAETQINSLRHQLDASDEIIATLKSEINTLQSTNKMYQDEIARIRKGA